MPDPSVPLAPREFPRTFVPKGLTIGNWMDCEPLLQELGARPLPDARALERFLADFGELNDILDEEGTLRYIRMTCRTDDPEIGTEYRRFLEKVVEPSTTRSFSLLKHYLSCPARPSLPRETYRVFDRDAANQVEIFREENVPLGTQEQALSQEYQGIAGAMTILFDGEERTLQQMGRYLELSDRLRREEAWRAIQDRRLRDRERLDNLYDSMRHLRTRISDNAGFADYRSYAFRLRGRFDYGIADCETFHTAIERCVVPLVRRLQARRADRLGLPALRPWDMQNDPRGLSALAPFRTTGELADKVHGILGKVDPLFGDVFGRMRDLKLLDLDSRKGKAPGGYNTSLAEARLPFIFMNAAGLDSDVRTLFHESGHAVHAFLSRDQPLSFYRHEPIEFAEVASMGMELLCEPHLGDFYADPKEAARSSLKHFEDILTLLPWIAQVDAFQHWVYTNPNQLKEERKRVWQTLTGRFGGDVDWNGLEEIQGYQWQKQLHLFEHPFYYIEYGIAQLGALQLWVNARKNRERALERYKRGLSLGGSLTLPALFDAAGLRFDFSEGILTGLMADAGDEIERLENLLDA